MHDISEEYLYSAHMLQHMMLSYFMPPLMLLATPTWLARLVVGQGRAWRAFQWLAKPVVAGVIFNAFVMISHVPGVVNHAVAGGNGLLHYSLHTVLVLSALLMWMPVCGPFPELRMGPGGCMIYLFVMSIIPTVPAGWLTFADGAVYKAYDHGPRLWGISVTTDQQMAGAIMKVGGSFFLWTIITVLFFKRFMGGWEEQNTYRRSRRMPMPRSPATTSTCSRTSEVTDVFDTVPPPPSPTARHRLPTPPGSERTAASAGLGGRRGVVAVRAGLAVGPSATPSGRCGPRPRARRPPRPPAWPRPAAGASRSSKAARRTSDSAALGRSRAISGHRARQLVESGKTMPPSRSSTR